LTYIGIKKRKLKIVRKIPGKIVETELMMMMMMMQNVVVLMQVCRLSSEESECQASERTTAAGEGVSSARAAATSPTSSRPRSNSRRSSYSGTSTASDAASSNGLSDDTVFDDSNDGAGQPGVVMSGAAKDGKTSTELVPPVPPPRRTAVSQPGYGDIWQRRAVRPATDGVHRRVLAAVDGSQSSMPKSCPSSPLLDNIGLRRAGTPQDGVAQSQIVSGRRTHPPPLQNDREAVVRGSASAPLNRRTKLPLSPLVRTQRDVR